MSGDRTLNSWELLIAYMVERGRSRDEIADEFDHRVAQHPEHPLRLPITVAAGELLDWGTLYGRRRIEPLIAAACGVPPEQVSSPQSSRGLTLDEIQATYRRLESEHDRRPTRLEVAGALHTSEATLKRAQKTLGQPKWPPF